jgi:hypothetical protein
MHAKFGFIARFARDQQLRGCELQLLFKPSDQVLGILYRVSSFSQVHVYKNSDLICGLLEQSLDGAIYPTALISPP